MPHLRLFLLTAFLILGVSFCSLSDTNEPVPNDNEATYLALGDSYTIGEGVGKYERWPVLLADTLTVSGYNTGSPKIIARTGWTTSELKAGIEDAAPEGSFDLVSLLIGVNNQYRGVSRGYTPDNYREEFLKLLNIAIDLAGGVADRVFVISIPDYSVTPFVNEDNKSRVSEEIDIYNEINRHIADSLNIKYFDITPISRLAATDRQLLAPDNLHPSGKMYKMWVELMIDDILKML